MKNIKIKRIYFEPMSLYQKAKTKSQRALLGYMIKAGFARDPIYGGAFRLVKEIESYNGIYILDSAESAEDTMEIIHIAESAMAGLWDSFSFSEREVTEITMQLGDLNKKGNERHAR